MYSSFIPRLRSDWKSGVQYVRCGSTGLSQIGNQWRYQKHWFTSFEDYQKMCFLAKFGGCRSKNKPATPLGSLKWSRAWQHHFSSYTHQTLWKVDFWWDLQLVKIWLWYLKALLSNSIFAAFLVWTPSLVGQKMAIFDQLGKESKREKY